VNPPLVSVIIPFYNRLAWLAAAVESVLGQTFDKFEIILVDDGSEQTFDDLTSLRDPRIRIVRQKHSGRSVARNMGIHESKGKYVAFLDSDDLFMPTKLEAQVDILEHQTDVGLVHTSYQRISRDARSVLQTIHSGVYSGTLYPSAYFYCPMAIQTALVRRELLGTQIRFEPGVELAEDTIFLIQVAKEAPIIGIDLALVGIRIHAENAMLDTQAKITGIWNIIHFAVEPDRDLDSRTRRRIMASKLARLGEIYLTQEDRVQCLANSFRALTYWPLERRVLSNLRNLLLHSHGSNLYEGEAAYLSSVNRADETHPNSKGEF